MTAFDQFGDSRPQPEQEVIKWQKLPGSDDELTLYFHSLAQTIRDSFNNYAFIIVPGSDASHIPGLDRKQPIKIPSLENVIDLFGLGKGVHWRYLGDQFQQPSRWYSYMTILQHGTIFEGCDETGRRLIEGHLYLEGGHSTQEATEIEKLDSRDRKTYGVSSKATLRRYTTDGSQIVFILGFDWPIEPGEDPTYEDLHFITSDGRKVVTRYSGRMVRKTKFLSYWDRAENFGIYYHEPFFQRGEESLTRSEVTQAYNLREALSPFTLESKDLDLLAFMDEEGKGEEYRKLKSNLELVQPRHKFSGFPLFELPSVLTILRLNEIAQFLEKRYREVYGLSEIQQKDYEERIRALRRQILLSLRQQAEFGSEIRENNWRSLFPLTEKNYLNYRSFDNSRESYPRGLGPFDPGPHNYGGPNDPRGPHPGGPDPRGTDPRGLR